MDINKLDGHRGFTLIELMIVVVIMGVLAAIVYPSYVDQVVKGKRADAKGKLTQAAQQLERYYTDNNTYVTDLGPLFGLAAGASVYTGDNPNDVTGAYIITAAAGAAGIASSYTLTATRNGGYTDALCGDLTLTHTGIKGISGGSSTVANCW